MSLADIQSDVSALPTDVDDTFPDRDPGDRLHQEHHDLIHAALRLLPDAVRDHVLSELSDFVRWGELQQRATQAEETARAQASSDVDGLRGATGGLASLDGFGKVPDSQLPAELQTGAATQQQTETYVDGVVTSLAVLHWMGA